MKPRCIIKDGGVDADCICSCGHKMRVRMWGIVYKRDKKGKILGQAKTEKDIRTCKCGRKYIFVCIPDIAWKLVEEK